MRQAAVDPQLRQFLLRAVLAQPLVQRGEVHVVERLVATGVLTQAQAKTVLAENLNLVPEGTGCRS